jgi:large subunit ribosomal protein L19
MAVKVISPVNVEHRKKLDIRPGDTVRVWQKIEEAKGKFRLQAFEGIVLARKHGREAGASFTVRKVIDGIGVERTFPLYSPMIDEVEMIRRSKVRRAKLYFIREKATKEIRRQMRRIMDAKYEEEPAPVIAAAPAVEAPKEEAKK